MKNVVLFIVDALKYSSVGWQCGASPSLTPNIDSIFQGGMRFHNIHSVSFPTQFAMPGIMASELPLSNGGYHLGITNRKQTLPEKFKEKGYSTVGITTDYHTSSCYGYARGFDKFVQLHDVAWHANGILRNDLRYLAQNGSKIGMPRSASLKMVRQKIDRYFPFAEEFLEDRAHSTHSDVPKCPSIDNWKFDKLQSLLSREMRSFKRSPDLFAERAIQGQSEWFNVLPPLRIAPHYPDADYVLRHATKYITDVTGPVFVYIHLTDVHGTLTEDLVGVQPVEHYTRGLRLETDVINQFGRLEQRYEGQGERGDWRAVRFVDEKIGAFVRDIVPDGSDWVVALTSDHGDHRSERYGYGAHFGVSDHLNLYDELTHVPFLVNDGINKGDYHCLLSTMDIAFIINKLSEGLVPPKEFLGDVQRATITAEHAYPGICSLQYKPFKIAVRSKTAKIVYFDSPSPEFGSSCVLQAFQLGTDPLEKRNVRGDVPHDLHLQDLARLAQERAATIRHEAGAGR